MRVYFCSKWLNLCVCVCVCVCGGGGVQFGVRKTIVCQKSLISYQLTRFLGVNVGIGDWFPSQKADIYDVIPLKIEHLFTLTFVLS